MAAVLGNRLVIAISSRTLFDLDASHEVFEREGLEAYHRYQIEHEDEVLAPGDAFPLVHKLLALNERLPEDTRVEVILMSRNSADTGLRVFNSIQHYGLAISRAAFCGGESPWRYVSAFGCHLFLSTGSRGRASGAGAGRRGGDLPAVAELRPGRSADPLRVRRRCGAFFRRGGAGLQEPGTGCIRTQRKRLPHANR
jgi:5'-nucleotidase